MGAATVAMAHCTHEETGVIGGVGVISLPTVNCDLTGQRAASAPYCVLRTTAYVWLSRSARGNSRKIIKGFRLRRRRRRNVVVAAKLPYLENKNKRPGLM